MRLTFKTIILCAFLKIFLQQVVGVKVHVGLKSSSIEHPDDKHMDLEQNAVNSNAFFGSPLRQHQNPERRSISRVYAYRKGCIHRNGICDSRQGDCCVKSSCRCNLWGSNCRWQSMGLFQKWG